MIDLEKLRTLYKSCVPANALWFPQNAFWKSDISGLQKFCEQSVMFANSVDDLMDILNYLFYEENLTNMEIHAFILCTLREEFSKRIEREKQQ